MQREQRSNTRGYRRALALGGALALAFAGSGLASASTQNPIAAKEWALATLNVTAVRQQYHAQGAGVVVAVIDSGVDRNQPDLRGRLVDGVNVTDPSNPTSDFSDTSSDSHGTAVSTIIAGYPHKDSSGNYYGMIGLADAAKIMPVKDGGNSGTEAATAAGIDYAVAHGAKVINISEGPNDAALSVVASINKALAAGVVVVVSAGNDAKSGNAANSYATVPGVLDVGGVDSNGQKYSFSHYGSDVNIAAPANDIEVGVTNGQYDNSHSGTSFAAPWVSAEAALLIAAHPTWTSGQIVATIIDNTVQSAGGQTKAGQRVDDNVGYGVIDPVAALGAAQPASTANPLGGPAVTGGAGASASASAGATGTGGATGVTTPTASSKSSSKAPLYIGIAVAAVVVLALLVFLLTRGNRNRGGKGGPGAGSGGGGGNGNPYYAQQQPNPYQQQQSQPQSSQGGYPPQGGYGQQGGGYGQQNPGQQNPYTGR
jgi:subtilisin family serine protease